MPDHFVTVFPTQPDFIPSETIRPQILDICSKVISKPKDVKICFESEIRPWGAFTTWKGVFCPYCRTELSSEWWNGQMNVAYQTDYTNLVVVVPCCGTVTSLNLLHYEPGAGFARFAIELWNPNPPSLLSPDIILALENVIGCQLRQFIEILE